MRDRSHPLELLRPAADGRSRAGVRRGLVIVADAGNRASLTAAGRLARGGGVRVAVTPHRDVDAVRPALAGRDEGAAIVVSDAVFAVGVWCSSPSCPPWPGITGGAGA